MSEWVCVFISTQPYVISRNSCQFFFLVPFQKWRKKKVLDKTFSLRSSTAAMRTWPSSRSGHAVPSFEQTGPYRTFPAITWFCVSERKGRGGLNKSAGEKTKRRERHRVQARACIYTYKALTMLRVSTAGEQRLKPSHANLPWFRSTLRFPWTPSLKAFPGEFEESEREGEEATEEKGRRRRGQLEGNRLLYR